MDANERIKRERLHGYCIKLIEKAKHLTWRKGYYYRIETAELVFKRVWNGLTLITVMDYQPLDIDAKICLNGIISDILIGAESFVENKLMASIDISDVTNEDDADIYCINAIYLPLFLLYTSFAEDYKRLTGFEWAICNEYEAFLNSIKKSLVGTTFSEDY